jgi:hypothetical protein
MTIHNLKTTLFAGLFLIGATGMALAQAAGDDHDVHHPEAGEPTLSDEAPNGAPREVPDGMSGMMDMMTPEMMQMMMRMMGEGGMAGMMGDMRGGAMAEGMPGPGMGQEMMGGGMPRSGMMGMHGMDMGPRGAQGPMGGHNLGPGALYGIPQGAPVEMTPARVETFLSHMLERHGNPRLEIGEITEAEDGSIIAEIVTVDGSLVQRLAFNRHPGLFRQID